MAILTIGIAGLVKSFGFIQRGVQLSKNKTLAANLAQEKMQILKQKPYYQIIVTSAPLHNTADFAPEVIDYDQGYFPPESIVEAGVTYTRYTYIQSIREDSGVIGSMAPEAPDAGMKRITVTVTWGQGSGSRKVTLRSIVSNPDTVMANVSFTGVVSSTWGAAVPGAMVSLVEMSGSADTTNSVGQYYLNAVPGTYTLLVTATGYFQAVKSVLVAAGETATNNFTLTRMAVGKVEGYAWLTDHLVISQVVGSTVDTSVTPNFDQEYVEIFNPTTYTWTVDGNLGLRFRRADDAAKMPIQINYLNAEIDSGGYYLFANTGTVVAGGIAMDADAVWDAGNSTSDFPLFASDRNVIPVDEDGGGEGGGALELYRLADGEPVDRVGWNKSGHPAPFYEGAAIPQTIGLSRNELYARRSSTADAAGVNWGFGPAYDTGNNSVDFYNYSSGLPAPPGASVSAVKTVISGTPAVGAVVSCSDGLSSSAEAETTGGALPAAWFSLVDVATGTWAVLISSRANGLSVSSAPVPDQGSVYFFASTSTLLTQAMTTGLITGRVVDAHGNPLDQKIVTYGGASNTLTGTDGRYRLQVTPGVVDVTANPVAGGVPSYVTASSMSIPIEIGEVHSGVDFVLYQGGRITGFVTRDGVNGLPGVSVAILDANSVAMDEQVTGSNGRFTSVVLSTGYYTVELGLGDLESSSPQISTVTISNMGGSHFSSTFTVFGAMGYVRGSVTSGGDPIKTGVLIVVSTMSLSGIPPLAPDISSATLTGPPFYMVSSTEDGSYLLEVRGSAVAYKVYAYYPRPSGTAAAILSTATTNIVVTPGQTTTGVNFSW